MQTSKMTEDDFSPLLAFENLYRYWWLVVLLTVWGGLIGWLIHRARPPVYDAQVVFYAAIDFSQFPETVALTLGEQDEIMWGAGAVLLSTRVVEAVVADALVQGIPITTDDLYAKSTLERKQANWFLILRDPDPQTAATLANLWGAQGLAALTEAREYALNAQAVQGYLDNLQLCLAGSVPADQLPAACEGQSEATLTDEISTTSEQLSMIYQNSRGLFPALLFELSQEASIPVEPARYGQSSLIFAGALIGFLLGTWAVNTRLPRTRPPTHPP